MSNEANPPNAPLGSPERRKYWTDYWNQWGSKDESHREYAGVIAEIQHDIALQQLQLEKYHGYKARGFSFADIAI
ncbi:hypothetical protein WB401_46355, partial [Streptomyces brasiliscabiei]|uniref:hypothetical protein n=1 Tax=Streptomyces brasiliscabiei TaxID=2736302 RepID=UPI003014693B